MSWLLAVSMPGILMVATVALQRIEGLLHRERPGVAVIAVRIERAVRAVGERPAPTPRAVWHGDEPTLPTKLCSVAMTNRRFQPSGSVNSV
jgi:hypothetical protein